jgi:formylglycine-generating enzyme required for sulfatase activity
MWKRFGTLAILTFLLAACSAGASNEVIVTQAPPPSPEVGSGNSGQKTVTPATAPLKPVAPSPVPAVVPFALGGEVVAEMVEVPAGLFVMGSDSADPDESPPHEVELPTFYIDRYEVTNGQFRAFVEATGYQTDAEKAGKRNWKDYSLGKANHPVAKVSWNDAAAFCEWVGKRLPTEEEWEKAARGTDGRAYPWGNEFDASRANVKLTGLRGTAAVGSFPAGASPYGAEDMSGNVWEWTASPYLGYPGSTYQDPHYGEELKVTRGGGWFDDEQQVRTANRHAADPLTASDDIGFRCAQH